MTLMGSSTRDGAGELGLPKAADSVVKCEGVEFTVTARNEVAVFDAAVHSESFFDAGTCTRHHYVDVQGLAEAMLFLVSVREDQRRIVAVSRC